MNKVITTAKLNLRVILVLLVEMVNTAFILPGLSNHMETDNPLMHIASISNSWSIEAIMKPKQGYCVVRVGRKLHFPFHYGNRTFTRKASTAYCVPVK